MAKPETDMQIPSLSTAAIFSKAATKKLIIEAQRQEQAGRRKFVIEKHARQTKEKAKLKLQRKKEHVLSLELSENIDKSRFHIVTKFNSGVDAAYLDMSRSLDGFNQQICPLQQETLATRLSCTRSLNEDEMGWESTDGNLSGLTSISQRISSLNKEVISGEAKLATGRAKIAEIDAALCQSAKGMLGHDAYERSVAGTDVESTWSNAEYTEMQAEIDAERKRVMELVKQENVLAVNRLQDAEEIYVARQKEITATQHSLSALLRDDEY